jgi:uncharacterized protein YbbC (DUF1343 family)
VLPGIDQIASGAARLPESARFALLTNRAAQTGDGRWTGAVLLERGYDVAVLLIPEHGLAADAAAGAPIGHSRMDDIPVLSLYGADISPVDGAIGGIDALVVDLPDVGCRYYTYGWTVREVLKLAARHGKPVYCLDRPNPLGGAAIEGNIPDEGVDSAVCASAVPVRHGLTLAELALWNRRHFGLDVEISVITAEGWDRDMTWYETGLPWVPPSPAIPSADSAWIYPGTCLLEGTNISEARGTDAPFTMAGAPWLDGASLARRLSQDEAWDGARIEPVTFTPQSSKWAGERCQGMRFTVQDREHFRPVRAGLALVAALVDNPEFSFRTGQFDALAGTSSWRQRLVDGATAAGIAGDWAESEATFRKQREAVLLYR